MCLNPPEEDLKILLCSENVPPQVNGIARRVGHYAEGLRRLGCKVDLLHPDSGLQKVVPHVNPWNFTARMMILLPMHLVHILNKNYDVVHVVLPLNLSGMWILAAFKALRSARKQSKPSLIVSWHCNTVDYVDHHSPYLLRSLIRHALFDGIFAILPQVSDRILTPTRSTDPQVVKLWKNRSGVCYTGIENMKFSPSNKNSNWGQHWNDEKMSFLQKHNCEFLIVCVGRLSPEKGVDELIKTLTRVNGCALWLVGDGPTRPTLEMLAKTLKVPVDFLGYQKGQALHAAYAVADLFVCPSLTETFGQTVNEALASRVRVTLPRVPVFVEAYSHVVPKDAFWEPLNRDSMASCIAMQLERHRNDDQLGIPNVEKFKSWDETCKALMEEYKKAALNREDLSWKTALVLPVWYLVTIVAALVIFLLSCIRTIFGGSVRVYFSTFPNRIEIKMKSIKEKILLDV